MIERDFYATRDDGVNLFITFSTEKKMIRKKGTEECYDAAIDIEGAPFEYEETDQPIDEIADEAEVNE